MYHTGSSVQNIWDIFKTELIGYLDKHIPSKLIRSKSHLPWINHNIRKIFKKKTRLYHQAKTNKWTNYKHFQKECKSQVRKAEWNYINDTMMEGLQNNNSKPFWKYVKSRKQDHIGVSPLKSNGQLVNDSKGKADILINQFKSVFTREENKTLPKTTKHISRSIPDLEIRSEGIEKLLKNINPSKASGPDNIPNRILKECAKQLAPGLTRIYQKSIDTGTLPRDWLNANVSCIFKKGDTHAPENYRPVSLTSVPCKLLEHVICKDMLKHLERHKVLTSLYHGFRSGYSCETELLVTLHDFMKSYDAGL
jgi:hypothetical protein